MYILTYKLVHFRFPILLYTYDCRIYLQRYFLYLHLWIDLFMIQIH